MASLLLTTARSSALMLRTSFPRISGDDVTHLHSQNLSAQVSKHPKPEPKPEPGARGGEGARGPQREVRSGLRRRQMPTALRIPHLKAVWIVPAPRPGQVAPACAKVRRSMHQDCLLNPRNFVFYPFFTHFPPFFAHFQRLDARNPGNTAKSPGENGKKSEKIGENRGN